MAKPEKKTRIPQLGFTAPNRPPSSRSRIPLEENRIFSSRSIPRPKTITPLSSCIDNKNNQPTTISHNQQHPKVFIQKHNDTLTITDSASSTLHERISPESVRNLNTSLNSTISFDNVLNSTFQNDSLSDKSNSASSINCTVIRNTSQNAVSSFNDQKVNLLADSALHESKLDQKHIGEQVVIDGTESGVLKFIGPVQFDRGIWCGVELNNPIGKHDGVVKGVRYFECRKNHGILAPVCKVDIATDAKSNFEKLKSKFEWYASKFPSPTNKFNKKHLTPLQRKVPNISNETVILGIDNNYESSSGPYSFIGIPSCIKDETIIESCNSKLEQDVCHAALFHSDSNLNARRRTITIDRGDFPNVTSTLATDNDSQIILSRDIETKERRRTYILTTDDFPNVTDVKNIQSHNDETVILNRNFEASSSCDNNTFPIINNDSLSESLNKEEVNKTIILNDCKSEPIISSSAIEKESLVNNINAIKITPQLKEELNSQLKRKNSLDSKYVSNRKCEFLVTPFNSTFNKKRSILYSPNKANLCSQNSLECDDSLGILTPNQMCIPKTPSTDDIHAILSEWKKSDKNKLEINNCESDTKADFSLIMSSTSNNYKNIIQNIQPLKRPLTVSPLTLESNSQLKQKNSLDSGYFNKKSPIISSPNTVTVDLCSQNSFECDESLGILTPNQMCEFPKTSSSDDLRAVLSEWRRFDRSKLEPNILEFELKEETLKTPTSYECVDNLNQQETESYEAFINRTLHTSEMSLLSPNVPDSFAADISLEVLNDDILTGTHFPTDHSISNLDTTINMDLPLDPDFEKGNLKQILRCEQTPSPEELPLDPVEIKNDTGEPVSNNLNTESESKTKSVTKTFNSFVMSVTSITSLDNGYQGDGEMSRPASRGGDHSPTVHKQTNQCLAAAINNQWHRAAVSRRPDPMTDSDFFTESDADGHDENAPKGDRKVQVIDGQLYGLNALNPQPAGEEIFVNNQNRIAEEMDSSGIFTDLDTNTRNDELSDVERNRNGEKVRNEEDQTPSDISSKTISENSQERQNEINKSTQNVSQIENTLSDTILNIENSLSSTESKSLPGSCQSSPSRKSNTSPKFIKTKEDTPKKYKMPRRNVVSKVKTMLESPKSNSIENQENRKPSKKNGKWDAVMSKITDSKPKLKEVKSKVACGIVGPGNENRLFMIPKISNVLGQNSNTRNNFQQTSPNTKLKRRTRTLKPNTNGAQTESIHSSLSDISNSGSLPIRSLSETANLQSFNRSAKKVITSTNNRCTSPPSNGDTNVSPRYVGVSPSTGSHRINRSSGSKKSPSVTPSRPTSNNDASSKRFTRQPRVLYNSTGAKNTTSNNSIVSNHSNSSNKDPTRLTGAPIAKARCVAAVQTVPESTPIPPENVIPQLQHAALGVEALGVLLQHLVFHYDAFKVPLLKKDFKNLLHDWTKIKLELDETRIGYRRVQELLKDERLQNETCQEEENNKNLRKITEINEAHRLAIIELSEKYTNEKQKIEQRLHDQFKIEEGNYTTQIDTLMKENEQWKTNFENLKIKYEEIQAESERINNNLLSTESEYKLKLEKANEKINRLQEEFKLKETELNEKISVSETRILVLEEESKKVVDCFKAETKEGRVQVALNRCMQLQDETESLRVVLDLKQKECADLRKKYEEATRDADRDADMLSSTLLNAQSLQARVEDLEIQLQRKIEFEKQLKQDNKKLHESFLQESEQKKRLSFQNEELQWKLKQNSEVVNVILSGIHTPTKVSTIHGSNQSLNEDNLLRSPRTSLARSFQTSSFSEKHTFGNASTPIDKNNFFNRDRFLAPKNNYSKLERKSPLEQKHDTEIPHELSYIEMEDVSPPSSPKIKAVVEKCDSVSYVIEIDEPPEVLANRMYRRSFRNSTPPKNTPTKSPNLKRYKSKTNHPLSLSASETSISFDNRDDDLRSRSKSMSIKKTTVSEKGRSDDDEEEEDDDECFADCWKSASDSNNQILDFRQKVKRVELGSTEISVESIADELIIDSDNKNEPYDEMNDYTDRSVHMSLPALPSELHRSQTDKNDHLPTHTHLLQNAFPKNSAGEAMMSESNSEDECSTSASSERSHSLSDVDPSENLAKSAAEICKQTSQMQYDLMLVTESTISENMDCSWSEDI